MSKILAFILGFIIVWIIERRKRMTDIVENIKCYIDNVIADEGILYKKNGRCYIQDVGLGVTRRISENQYEIIKENGYC